MTVHHVDNRLTTGANDGSTPADAWQSIADISAAAINAAGDMVSFAEGSGPYREAFDTQKNGAAGNPIIWLGNGVEVSAGRDMNDAAYKWTASGAGTNEYYLELAAGGNPSLAAIKALSVNGWAWITSADDAGHTMGTPGSIALDLQPGFGDADTLGYNTLYIRDNSLAPASQEIIAPQSNYAYNINWGNHDIYDFRFTHGNVGPVLGIGLNINLYRCMLAYGDFSGFRTGANGTLGNEFKYKLHDCVTYWTGHRATQVDNVYCEVEQLNCVDYSSHLSVWIIGTADATTVLDVQSCISENGEAGGCDIRSATAIFTEGNNCWHPRMTAPSGALGYLSSANWLLTDATDSPPDRDTTETSQASLFDPKFKALSDYGYDECDFELKDNSSCKLAGVQNWGPATRPRGWVDTRGKTLVHQLASVSGSVVKSLK